MLCRTTRRGPPTPTAAGKPCPAHKEAFRRCLLVPQRHAAVPKLGGECRWAPDSKEEAAGTSDTPESTAKDTKQSRRLINQLLQIQSMSSLQSVDIASLDDQDLHLDPPAASSSSSGSAPTPAPSLFDDPAAEDFDPLVLDMLGFTSVAQYLDSKTATAAGQAKLSLAAVLTWALMGAAMVLPLGGLSTTYSDSLAILTDGGLQMDNLLFLWVAVLAYFSVKGCVMSLVVSFRAWRLHEQQDESLKELAQTVQAQDQRRAFWKLQERLQNADDKAHRQYGEFALASLLLGVLLLMSGGTEHLELQLETLDEESYLKLLVVLWLFWETYFATVGATVKVSNWVGVVLQKWQYNRKWGARAGVSKSRQ